MAVWDNLKRELDTAGKAIPRLAGVVDVGADHLRDELAAVAGDHGGEPAAKAD